MSMDPGYAVMSFLPLIILILPTIACMVIAMIFCVKGIKFFTKASEFFDREKNRSR